MKSQAWSQLNLYGTEQVRSWGVPAASLTLGSVRELLLGEDVGE